MVEWGSFDFELLNLPFIWVGRLEQLLGGD